MPISNMQQPRQMYEYGGLSAPRQNYGLGSFVKKAVRGVKKVVKSPLGKMALLGTAANFAPMLFGKGTLMSQAGGLSGLKSRLTEAQINKFEADVANMSAQQIVSEMNAINKSVESGAIQIDEELQAYMSSLRARLSSMRSESGTGFAASEAPTGGDILDRNRVA